MFTLRAATPSDLPTLLPRTRALNDHEAIDIDDAALASALATLLADPTIGGVWLVLAGDAVVGYAIVTFGYDLEFGGRDAFLTELWIDPAHRGQGAGDAALTLLDPALRALGVLALHLQVRPENPALRLYQRAGFHIVPRHIMTRRMV